MVPQFHLSTPHFPLANVRIRQPQTVPTPAVSVPVAAFAPEDLLAAVRQLVTSQQNLVNSQQQIGQQFQLVSQHVDQLAQHQLKLQAYLGHPAPNNQIPPLDPTFPPVPEQPPTTEQASTPHPPNQVEQPPSESNPIPVPPAAANTITNAPSAPTQATPLPTQPLHTQASTEPPPSVPITQTAPPTISASAPAPARSPPKCNLPEVFKGKVDDLDRFVDDVTDVLVLTDASFTTDYQRIIWVSTFLQGSAKAWWSATKKKRPEVLEELKTFLAALVEQFSPLDPAQYARDKCRALKQTGSALDYANKFRLLSIHLDDTESAQCDMFYQGLKGEVKDALSYIGGAPNTLNKLERSAIKMVERIFERNKERRLERLPSNQRTQPSTTSSNPKPSSDNSSSVPPGTPMQVDTTKTARMGKVSAAERERRIKNNLCGYCGESGHYKARCPSIPRVNATITEVLDEDWC